MAVGLKRKKGGPTDKLLMGLKSLDSKEIQVGHFADQGTHSGSNLTYPELLALYAFGVVEGQPIRNPLLAFDRQEIDTKNINSKLAPAMKLWAKTSTQSTSDEKLLNDLGTIISEDYKEVFGVTGPLMPPDADGTPMFETGELKDKTTYKVVSSTDQ